MWRIEFAKTTKMRNYVLILIITLGFFSNEVVSQELRIKYKQVTESVYDYNTDQYQDTATYHEEGHISIYEKSIVIEGYNNQTDKQLQLVEKEKENNGSEELYICAMHGKYYAFSMSKQQEHLTLVSADNRFIFKIK